MPGVSDGAPVEVRGASGAIGGRPILRGIDLEVSSGQVHAVMGPNGSGKSTLAHVIMGGPGYEVYEGSVTLDGVDLLALPTWERADEVRSLATIVVVERPGTRGAEPPPGWSWERIEVPRLEVSSTDLRARVADGRRSVEMLAVQAP